MKTYQLKFLAWTFSAFLPPKSDPYSGETDQEVDYYELLGVAKNANADDIKKAYRKRSLELHPDKLRQRGMKFQGDVITEDKARQMFQHMKAAYDVLSDPKKRKVYDALGHKGMDFIINPSHAWDPHVLLGNLAKSSVFDRAKLMALILLFFGLTLMQPILICAKVDQILEENGGALAETSWFAILVPFWIFSLCFGVVLIIGKALFPLLELISLVTAAFFFSLKFENIVPWAYSIVFCPLYAWIFFRVFEANMEMKAVKTAMSKMVTIEYIEKYVLNEKKQDENGNDIEGGFHRTYEDLTPEERDQINEEYIIVHVPPRTKGPGETGENSIEHDLDEIERSNEYQEALAHHQSAFKKIQKIILPEVPLMVLVIIQLDLHKNWNWGLTFLPLWVSMGLECCGGCYGFFCTATLAHIEVQEAMEAHFSEKQDTDETEKEESKENGTKEKSKENNAKGEGETTKKLDGEVNINMSNTDETTELGKDAVADLLQKDAIDSVESGKDVVTDTLQKDAIDTAIAVDLESDAKAARTDAEVTPPKTGDASDNAIPQNEEKESEVAEEDEDFLRNVFSMDEETYQYYQEAEQEAESKATEAQSKAIASFCNTIFQAIIAALFVAKLNQVYDERDDEPIDGTDSYSTFWILFPFLLIAGCTVCCCSCAIFCAADIDNVISSDDKEGDGDNQNEEQDVPANDSMPMPAVVEDEAVVIESSLTSEGMELDIEGNASKKSGATSTNTANEDNAQSEDMNDLD